MAEMKTGIWGFRATGLGRSNPDQWRGKMKGGRGRMAEEDTDCFEPASLRATRLMASRQSRGSMARRGEAGGGTGEGVGRVRVEVTTRRGARGVVFVRVVQDYVCKAARG